MNADFYTTSCSIVASSNVDAKSDTRAGQVVAREAAFEATVIQQAKNKTNLHNNESSASVNQLNKPSSAIINSISGCATCSTASATSNLKLDGNNNNNNNYNICHQEILATPQAECNNHSHHHITNSTPQHHHNHHNHNHHSSSHYSCPRCTATTTIQVVNTPLTPSATTAIALTPTPTQTTPTSQTTKTATTTTTQHIDDEDTNQLGDSYSNSFLFWKFLSNLPKSITQRSKSTTSTTLTPEVAGYLASKQQCSNVVAAAAAADMSAMTAATSYDEGIPPPPTTTTTTTNSTKRQPPQQQQQLQQQRMGAKTTDNRMAAGEPPAYDECTQLSQDGQRLIKIIAPTTISLSQQQQQQQQQQETSTRETSSLSNDPKHHHHIKLSIATTTTTTTTGRSDASSLSSCILSDSSTSEVRLKWGKKMDFLLSIIGFAVDLANIWRFPYLVYKNGGGVFLIPYIIMLIFGGIPLFFLELCLGQFVKKGPITVWNKICPSMKGVGYCSILISWYVSFYYNVLIAWSVYFIYRSLSSFGDKMPWEDCDNSWNSKGTCVSISQLKILCSTRNETLEACRKEMFAAVNVTSPASEFFVKELSQIDQSSGLDDMGYLRPELVLCTIVVYLLHYFSLFRGLETSGKVVWVTATAPYMILSILLVRGLFLPGASMGIEYYLSPKLEKLADPQVWVDAAGQVFYSIGVGFGVHLTYASFNSHNNDCYRDCLMTSAVNALTSVYSGLVVFVYLGYMAKNLGIEIDKVASEGYSLVFEVYPEALTTLPFARFWSILFFIMLLTLGIDSAMGGLEAVITGLEDEFRFAKRLSRGQLTGLVIFSSFLPALISCTQGGAYTLFWFDIYSAGVSLLFSALFETIGVVYCYGINKFISNIESMLGRRPHLFYILCWKYISPIFLGGVIFMSIYTAQRPTYRGYTFPLWSIILGWCLAFSSVAAIPIVAIYHWYWSYVNRGKELSTPDKSARKRDRGSSSVASSRHGSSKKSPNHRSLSVSCTGQAQSTTTILTTSREHHYPSLGDNISCRTSEDML